MPSPTTVAELLRAIPRSAMEVWDRMSPLAVAEDLGGQDARRLRAFAKAARVDTMGALLVQRAVVQGLNNLPLEERRSFFERLHGHAMGVGGGQPERVRGPARADVAVRPPSPFEGPLQPGMPAAALLAWAERNHMAEVPGWPFAALENEQGFRWFSEARAMTRRDTVGALICAPRPGPGGQVFSMATPAMQTWACALLQRLAATGARTTPWVTVRTQLRPPLDASLGEMFRRLQALDESFPAAVQAARFVRPMRYLLDAAQAALALEVSGLAFCDGGPAHGPITLWFAEESVRVTCQCSSRAPTACALARFAVANTLLWLADPNEATTKIAWAKDLLQPWWGRLFASLDAVLGTENAELPLLGWAVEPERLRVEPVQVVPKARGNGAKILLYPRDQAHEAMRAGHHPNDERVAQALGFEDRFVDARSPHDQFAAALAALTGHPRVFLWPSKQPVLVREAPLGLEILPDGGGVTLAVTIDGAAVPVPAIVGAVVSTADGGVWTSVNEEEGTLRYTRLTMTQLRVLQLLQSTRGQLPAAAVPELLRRLPRLTSVVPARAPRVPGTEAVPAEERPVLFLERLPGEALAVRLRVRPLRAGALFLPGEGPSEVFATDGARLLVTTRSFGAERARAEIVLAATGLSLADEPGLGWVLTDPERALGFLQEVRALGDTVEVAWRGTPVRIAAPVRGRNLSVRVGGARGWFGLSGEAQVEGQSVPLAALLEAAEAGRAFVRLGPDTWASVEDGLRRRLAELASVSKRDKAGATFGPVHAPLVETLGELEVGVTGDGAWADVVRRLHEAAALPDRRPEGLTADLRQYQAEGLAWMRRLAHWAGGAVLADEMGLGKTLQALALLLDRASLGPALVVAPTSLGFNWQREAARFTPSLRLRLHQGGVRERSVEGLGPGDVVVTSYDLLHRDIDGWTTRFATAVFDEAHALKNPDTLRARAAVRVQADVRVALTGTPLENRLSELWSLFQVVVPGLLGGWDDFRSRFVLPIEARGDPGARERLAGLVRPFLLRRRKAEVAADLPPRTEVQVDVDLDPAARARYEQLRAATAAALDGLDPSIPPERRRFVVLAALTRLRQLACHPRLVDDAWETGSAKLTALLELVEELKAEGRRVLVFSQFTELLALVRSAFDAAAVSFCYLDGSLSAKERAAEVERFSTGTADAFLLSTKAGGAGLNLVAASDVVLLDPWWNPAVEDQAADRAHRIGQTRAVTIYRLVARGTVEEQILALHASKRDLVTGVLEGTGNAGALSVADLEALLAGGLG